MPRREFTRAVYAQIVHRAMAGGEIWLMTTKQKTAYLDGVNRHFSERGIVLTQPEDNGRVAA